MATNEQIVKRLGKLQSVLLISGLQKTNQPLYQVISQLIDTIIESSSGVVQLEEVVAGTGDMSGPAASTDNAVALFDGTTGKLLKNSLVTVVPDGTVNSERLVVSDSVDIQEAPATTPPGLTARVTATGLFGSTFLEITDSAGRTMRVNRDLVIIGRVDFAGGIGKGVPVYISGQDGDVRLIAPAMANSGSTMPAIAVTLEGGPDDSFLRLMICGQLSGIDTSAWPAGTELYVAPAGELTDVRPSASSDIAQQVATVLDQDATDGAIGVLIFGPVPNIAPGTGDVTGPASSTDNAITRFDGVTGKIIQNSLATLDDTGVIVAAGLGTTPLNATQLTTGTVPDARFPAVLPAVSGANLTNLDASDLATGTIPDARFPAILPAVSGQNLTNLDASDLATGTIPDGRFPATLPAVSGANLTNLHATNLTSGTVPDGRFPAILPAVSGALLTNLHATNITSGTVPVGVLPASIAFENEANIFTVTPQSIHTSGPALNMFNTNPISPIDNRRWDIRISTAGTLNLAPQTDAGGTLAPPFLFFTTGTLSVPSGITFPAIQLPSVDPNTLDDYEEGTWTPTIVSSNGAGSGQTYTRQVARYVKIGKAVFIYGDVTLSNKGTIGTLGGSARIAGLPFPAENVTGLFGSIQIQWFSLATAQVYLTGVVNPTLSTIAIWGGAAAMVSNTALPETAISNSTEFVVMGYYRTDN